jgi:hypothetical protein
MRPVLLAFCLSQPFTSLSQEYDSPLGKGKINKNFCVRSEWGWNKSWFTSLGASYVYSNVNGHVPFAFVVYAAADANFATYRSPSWFYAYKAGFEVSNLLLAYGAELRNNTDFAGTNHLVFMPKAGFTFFGHASLFYGYNVFRNANNVFGIGHSQLSLSFSFNRKVFTESRIPGGEKNTPVKEPR